MAIANVVATLTTHGGYHAVTVDDIVYVFHSESHCETFTRLREETGLDNARIFFEAIESDGEAFTG